MQAGPSRAWTSAKRPQRCRCIRSRRSTWAEPMPGTSLATFFAGLSGLDALVNAAGIQGVDRIDATSLAAWDEVMDANARGTFLAMQAAHPQLQRSRGAVVNVASVHAYATSSGAAPYAASKGAIVALTRAAAIEWAPDVRVNAVAPGAVDTQHASAGNPALGIAGGRRGRAGGTGCPDAARQDRTARGDRRGHPVPRRRSPLVVHHRAGHRCGRRCPGQVEHRVMVPGQPREAISGDGPGRTVAMRPLVSVIIPAHNPGRYIEPCIRSILRQSLSRDQFEVVFVDDGSTDGTGKRLDRLAREQPNVRVIHIPASGGPGRAAEHRPRDGARRVRPVPRRRRRARAHAPSSACSDGPCQRLGHRARQVRERDAGTAPGPVLAESRRDDAGGDSPARRREAWARRSSSASPCCASTRSRFPRAGARWRTSCSRCAPTSRRR